MLLHLSVILFSGGGAGVACVARGRHVWWGACIAGGMRGKACVAEGMCGRRHVWWGGAGGGHVRQERRPLYGMHPTCMHSVG